MTEEDAVASSGLTLASVSVKLPPFWSADPEIWFVQVEAQFTTKGIVAQKTKYDYVVSSLTPEFAMEVRDLLLNPPTVNPYDTLKTQLIKRTTASEQQKLQQLISGEELGDRKPTQLLRRMQQLLGDKLGTSSDANSFVCELFFQRLPSNVRMVLASMDTSMDINKLADMADKVMEVATPTTLRDEVTRLIYLVASLSTRFRGRSNSQACSSRRSRSPVPSSNSSSDTLCWYHAKFGEKAEKCREPCNWGNTQAGH